MSSAPSICVISICSLKHADVWKLTSRLLPQYVGANEFIVYVPDREISEFLKITDPAIQVLPQSTLDRGFAASLRKQLDSFNNMQRFGWYLQQFFKIEALLQSKADLLVIWDADCVPVKKIALFDKNGVPVYMWAGEYHAPYFQMINRLLGLSRIENQSFIIPGFPIRREWVNDLIRNIENKHEGRQWFESIIACTDLSQMSGFSETETLGTWVVNSYPNSWTTSKLSWERFGQSRFGYAKDLTVNDLISLGQKENLDIITFENWDSRGMRGFFKRIRRLLFSFKSGK